MRHADHNAHNRQLHRGAQDRRKTLKRYTVTVSIPADSQNHATELVRSAVERMGGEIMYNE